MNAIVRKTYPAANLPPDLREGLAEDAVVTVTVEVEEGASNERPPSPTALETLWAARRPPFRTKEEIDASIRALRDEWGD